MHHNEHSFCRELLKRTMAEVREVYTPEQIKAAWVCTDCGERWNDIYKLTAVTTEDGDLLASISIPEEKHA